MSSSIGKKPIFFCQRIVMYIVMGDLNLNEKITW